MMDPPVPVSVWPALVSLHVSHWRCQQVFCRSQFFFGATTLSGAAPLSDKCRRLQRRWLADWLALLHGLVDAQEPVLAHCIRSDSVWQPYLVAWSENHRLGKDCLVRVGQQCLTEGLTGCAANAPIPL
ncbi:MULTISPECIES: hypothetical protein [unclassified Paludibacterium]|uniref:hypothetical protein n=1 Tax=unclassified Paludibacterium TaxID=2618429 RepID=UPI001C047237|nr:hypothetical protein [Paludibacterium sp. B53371]BEV72261.1 hypothetical protein THUN1379_17430 [Paludibacterium sp. THUN1379]